MCLIAVTTVTVGRINSGGTQRCNLFAVMQFTGQNNGRSASSAFLLAKKMPLIGQNLPIMSMRSATCMERQTSEVSTRIAFLLFVVPCSCTTRALGVFRELGKE